MQVNYSMHLLLCLCKKCFLASKQTCGLKSALLRLHYWSNCFLFLGLHFALQQISNFCHKQTAQFHRSSVLFVTDDSRSTVISEINLTFLSSCPLSHCFQKDITHKSVTSACSLYGNNVYQASFFISINQSVNQSQVYFRHKLPIIQHTDAQR